MLRPCAFFPFAASPHNIGAPLCFLPSRVVLSALLTAAPQLEVRLLMAATLERWLALGQSAGPNRVKFTEQWQELQRMGAEMDGVIIAN